MGFHKPSKSIKSHFALSIHSIVFLGISSSDKRFENQLLKFDQTCTVSWTFIKNHWIKKFIRQGDIERPKVPTRTTKTCNASDRRLLRLYKDGRFLSASQVTTGFGMGRAWRYFDDTDTNTGLENDTRFRTARHRHNIKIKLSKNLYF